MTSTRTDDKVIRLPAEPPPATSPPPSRPTGLHGVAITGMALSALIGIASMFGLISVAWTEDWRRFVVGAFVGSIVAFMTCASIAVFSAARTTYGQLPAGDDADG